MTTTELPLDSPDHPPTKTAQYRVGLATRRVDVLAAQRLRDEIFTAENGALTPGPPGLDRERLRPAVPPLLRGYLRLGAVACGPPAADPVFHTVDFLMLLDQRSANDRYLRYLDQVAG